MPFVARSAIRDGDRSYQVGDIVPGAGEWSTILAEVRLGRVEPVRVAPDGTLRPVRYRVRRSFDDHNRGEILEDATAHPSFRALVRRAAIEPVLEDALDVPPPPARHETAPRKKGR